MIAYPFKGYWKDVGTIKSLWEANQDLIGEDPAFDIYNPFWKIHSRNVGIEPQYIAKDAVLSNSLITDGAKIEGTVINSIIGSSVVIKKEQLSKIALFLLIQLLEKIQLLNIVLLMKMLSLVKVFILEVPNLMMWKLPLLVEMLQLMMA